MPQQKENPEKAKLQGMSTAMAIISNGTFKIVEEEQVEIYLAKLPEFMSTLRDTTMASSATEVQTGVTPPLRSMEVEE